MHIQIAGFLKLKTRFLHLETWFMCLKTWFIQASSRNNQVSSFELRLSTYFWTVLYNTFIISYTDCEDL